MEAVKAGSYRLKVRLGSHEFEADGPEEVVREQFAIFLQAANSLGAAAPSPRSNSQSESGQGNGEQGRAGESEEGNGDVESMWNRAYKRNGDRLSLHVLPQTKTQNADAILLLLYGYQTILKQESVKTTDAMDAAKQSGLRIDRIDRNLPASHNALVIRGGNGKGTRYSLNNRGLAYAQELLEQMFE